MLIKQIDESGFLLLQLLIVLFQLFLVNRVHLHYLVCQINNLLLELSIKLFDLCRLLLFQELFIPQNTLFILSCYLIQLSYGLSELCVIFMQFVCICRLDKVQLLNVVSLLCLQV